MEPMVGAVHRTARAIGVNRPYLVAATAFEKAVGGFAARRKFCGADALS